MYQEPQNRPWNTRGLRDLISNKCVWEAGQWGLQPFPIRLDQLDRFTSSGHRTRKLSGEFPLSASITGGQQACKKYVWNFWNPSVLQKHARDIQYIQSMFITCSINCTGCLDDTIISTSMYQLLMLQPLPTQTAQYKLHHLVLFTCLWNMAL